jgi:4-diphosphocytidyl-2-C-methyl-D-erythritol kinase
MRAAIREPARGKVNLTLTVHGRRADGYHELESLVTFAAVHDVVSLDPDGGGGLEVSGPFAPDLAGGNILATASTLLRDADPGLRIGTVHLEKRLPVAAGLGGGSADAAALLRAVRRANAGRTARTPWEEIAARLGSDVPVCLGDCPALVWGRGERMAPVRRLPAMDAVLVNPRVPLSTAAVFAALGRAPAGPAPMARAAPDLATLAEALDYVRTRGNDLEAPATGLLPVIGEIKAMLAAQAGCRLVAMSGSGPTCFAVLSDPEGADRAAANVAAARPEWWVVATTLSGSSR